MSKASVLNRETGHLKTVKTLSNLHLSRFGEFVPNRASDSWEVEPDVLYCCCNLSASGLLQVLNILRCFSAYHGYIEWPLELP